MKQVDIYFENLNEKTQQELLELYEIENPDEMNWGVFPVTTIEKPEPFEE